MVRVMGELKFEREDRYIVIKRSDLKKVPLAYRRSLVDPLFSLISHVPRREYLVLESDWPEYEPTWKAIEDRVSGSQPEFAPSEVKRFLVSDLYVACCGDTIVVNAGDFDSAQANNVQLSEALRVAQKQLGNLWKELDAQRLRADTAEANFSRCNGLYYECQKERDTLRSDLAAAEQRIAELSADKARIDFWQANPQYAGGFAPSGDWSFFSRELKTCYGEDLRAAFDRLQVMHAALNPNPEAESHEG